MSLGNIGRRLVDFKITPHTEHKENSPFYNSSLSRCPPLSSYRTLYLHRLQGALSGWTGLRPGGSPGTCGALIRAGAGPGRTDEGIPIVVECRK